MISAADGGTEGEAMGRDFRIWKSETATIKWHVEITSDRLSSGRWIQE
jgi:hypothetical protein